MRLPDTVAVVTGASSSIGRAIARQFADEGAAVAIGDVRRVPKPHPDCDEDPLPTDVVIREDGGEAVFVETDVGDPDQCETLIETTVDTFDRIDILVNNAGIVGPTSMTDSDPAEWDRVVSVNLSGAFYCTSAAMPYLLDSRGSVINISSVKGIEGGSGPSYSATKAGIINFTRDLATEFGAAGVRANTICPGPVWTGNWAAASAEQIEDARDRIVLPRFGQPEDISNAAVFLASNEADWITGAALFVDGGTTAHR